MFHTIVVLVVMLLAPAFCTVFEFIKWKKDIIKIGFRWFLFWTVGVRALTAGFLQFANPNYTMKLLSIGADSKIIVRELGAIQFAVGLIAIISVWKKNYIEPALICIGIFMLGATYLHMTRISNIDSNEFISLIGDFLIVVITAIYFFVKVKNLISKNRT